MKSPRCLPSDRYLLSRSIPNPGVAWLDGGIDEMNALLVRQERALHCIDRDLLKVVQREPKCFCGCCKLLAHGGAAHQPVVRVQRDAELLLIKNFERMLRQTGCCARVYVAQQANLQGDALVEDVL